MRRVRGGALAAGAGLGEPAAVEPALALLPSPLLGPAVWVPVAARLRADGYQVLVPPLPVPAPRTPGEVLAGLAAALPGDRPLVLVPHSNAGLYVPALTVALDVVGVVFTDAGLPPARGRVPLAPSFLLDHLTGLADGEGLLPVWSGWFDEAAVAGLFPDPDTRRTVEAEQRRLPLDYFRSSLEIPPGWTTVPAAYLAFGESYAPERERAAAWGWPVRTLAGGHLHQLVAPGPVAGAVSLLLEELGLPTGLTPRARAGRSERRR